MYLKHFQAHSLFFLSTIVFSDILKFLSHPHFWESNGFSKDNFKIDIKYVSGDFVPPSKTV